MAKSGKMGSSLYGGLTKKSPSGTEPKPSGPSVDMDSVRGGVAPSPKTMGGRTA